MEKQPGHLLPSGSQIDIHGNPLSVQMPPGHPCPPHGPPGVCHGPCCTRMPHGQGSFYPYGFAPPYSDMRPRKRTAYTPQQVEVLEEQYAINPYIDMQGRTELAQLLGLQESQLKVWFQNRRARERRDDPEGEDRLMDYLSPKKKKVQARRSGVSKPYMPESPVSNFGSPPEGPNMDKYKKLRRYPCTAIPSNIKFDHWTYSFHRKMGRYDLKELTKISTRFQEEYQNQQVKKKVKEEINMAPLEQTVKMEPLKKIKVEKGGNPKRASRRSCAEAS